VACRTWFEAAVGGHNVILRRTSALEFLDLFFGYMHDEQIDVYALEPGIYENVNYHIVDSFDGIEFITVNNVKCTTINYTFNEILGDFDNIDKLAFIKALKRLYFSNDECFDKLTVLQKSI
jgi:hypothetical protein